MNLLKKLILSLLAVLLVVVAAFAGFVWLVGLGFDDMCSTTIHEERVSPDKKHKAVVFQVDCGATTGFNTHIAMVSGDTDTSQADKLPKSFFVADTDHGRAPAGKNNGPEVRLLWLSEKQIEVRHHLLINPIRAETSSAGVSIVYRALP